MVCSVSDFNYMYSLFPYKCSQIQNLWKVTERKIHKYWDLWIFPGLFANDTEIEYFENRGRENIPTPSYFEDTTLKCLVTLFSSLRQTAA